MTMTVMGAVNAQYNQNLFETIACPLAFVEPGEKLKNVILNID